MFRIFAISTERVSISCSLRCPKILAARSGPSVTSIIAAFCGPPTPRDFFFCFGASRAASSAILVLEQPGADLRDHRAGVAVEQENGRERRAQRRRGRGR